MKPATLIAGTAVAPRPQGALPERLLYSVSARIGGTGLDSVAHQTLIGAERGGFLARAIAWDNRQTDVPASRIRSLRWHPARLLSFLDAPHYYGAKKQYLDWITSRELASGRYDFFHGWSGDSVRTLRVAKRLGIPTLLEIPTWHRNKGKIKPSYTKSEREIRNAPWRERLLQRLLVSRQAIIEEYELADVLLVQSTKAADTFLAAGIPAHKLFMVERAADVGKFHPGPPPAKFRVLFVGALIERKGVHILLEAWRKLGLKNAELVLAGTVHDEIKPWIDRFGGPDVLTPGFAGDIAELYRSASIHVLPSLCEGSAKVVFEAAASGLAQVMTRESGDFVVDGVHGRIVPAENVDALADAIRELHDDPGRTARMGAAARRLAEDRYTWDHFRARMLDAYRLASERAGSAH